MNTPGNPQDQRRNLFRSGRLAGRVLVAETPEPQQQANRTSLASVTTTSTDSPYSVIRSTNPLFDLLRDSQAVGGTSPGLAESQVTDGRPLDLQQVPAHPEHGTSFGVGQSQDDGFEETMEQPKMWERYMEDQKMLERRYGQGEPSLGLEASPQGDGSSRDGQEGDGKGLTVNQGENAVSRLREDGIQSIPRGLPTSSVSTPSVMAGSDDGFNQPTFADSTIQVPMPSTSTIPQSSTSSSDRSIPPWQLLREGAVSRPVIDPTRMVQVASRLEASKTTQPNADPRPTESVYPSRPAPQASGSVQRAQSHLYPLISDSPRNVAGPSSGAGPRTVQYKSYTTVAQRKRSRSGMGGGKGKKIRFDSSSSSSEESDDGNSEPPVSSAAPTDNPMAGPCDADVIATGPPDQRVGLQKQPISPNTGSEAISDSTSVPPSSEDLPDPGQLRRGPRGSGLSSSLASGGTDRSSHPSQSLVETEVEDEATQAFISPDLPLARPPASEGDQHHDSVMRNSISVSAAPSNAGTTYSIDLAQKHPGYIHGGDYAQSSTSSTSRFPPPGRELRRGKLRPEELESVMQELSTSGDRADISVEVPQPPAAHVLHPARDERDAIIVPSSCTLERSPTPEIESDYYQTSSRAEPGHSRPRNVVGRPEHMTSPNQGRRDSKGDSPREASRDGPQEDKMDLDSEPNRDTPPSHPHTLPVGENRQRIVAPRVESTDPGGSKANEQLGARRSHTDLPAPPSTGKKPRITYGRTPKRKRDAQPSDAPQTPSARKRSRDASPDRSSESQDRLGSVGTEGDDCGEVTDNQGGTHLDKSRRDASGIQSKRRRSEVEAEKSTKAPKQERPVAALKGSATKALREPASRRGVSTTNSSSDQIVLAPAHPPPPESNLTPQERQGGKTNDQAFRRVFAYWPETRSYFPGQVVKLGTKGIWVRFDDEMERELQPIHLRRCELMKGDVVLFRGDTSSESQEERLAQHFEVVRVERATTRQEATGELQRQDVVISLPLNKAVQSETEKLLVEAIHIPAHPKKYASQLDDRKLSDVEIASLLPTGLYQEERFPRRSTSVSSTGRPASRSTSISNGVAGRSDVVTGLFSGYGIILTYSSDTCMTSDSDVKSPRKRTAYASNKEAVGDGLRNCGATLIDDINDVLSAEENSQEESVTAVDLKFKSGLLDGLQTILLLADRPLKTLKYLMALAVGIPCVSTRWAEQCRLQGTVLDWRSFMIGSGYSVDLGSPAYGLQSRLSSRTDFDAKSIERFQEEFKLFKDTQFAFICTKSKRSKEYQHSIRSVLTAMGASRVETIQAHLLAKRNEESLARFDFVVLEDHREIPPALTRSIRQRVVDFEFIKQCLIAGRVLECGLWSKYL